VLPYPTLPLPFRTLLLPYGTLPFRTLLLPHGYLSVPYRYLSVPYHYPMLPFVTLRLPFLTLPLPYGYLSLPYRYPTATFPHCSYTSLIALPFCAFSALYHYPSVRLLSYQRGRTALLLYTCKLIHVHVATMYLEQLAHSDSKQGGSNKAIHMYVCGYCIAVAESKCTGDIHVL
jgi:hypothetical protein